MNDENDILGRGWGFPPTFVRGTGAVSLVEGALDVAQSLQLLLATALGERLMRPSYGCDLRAQLFENLDEGLRAYLRDRVRTAVLYHEPRVRLDDLTLSAAANDGNVSLAITYTIRTTNTRHNLVYPLYREEASEAQP
jgi:phage baseplate assembly protein W